MTPATAWEPLADLIRSNGALGEIMLVAAFVLPRG